MKVPPHMSWAEAATLGTGMGTMGLALFHNLCVPGYPTSPAPPSAAKTVLVYGGSTASGTLALQLLKLSGLNPITTCSPSNFKLVKSYGASEAFDYKSPDCIKDIKAYTGNSLKYVLDCVSEPETMEFCYSCVGRGGGKLTTLEPPPSYLNKRARSVKVDWVLGPALHGKAIGWPAPMEREADPQLREFAKKWTTTVQELFDGEKVRTHPIREMEGGLEGVLQGLDILKRKEVSGEKLVYKL
jgi:NADPH:quinone reductase-like Zn-dependent oxidoreductase